MNAKCPRHKRLNRQDDIGYTINGVPYDLTYDELGDVTENQNGEMDTEDLPFE
jgi:hypothetical protein